jgi:hypothetical protein
MSKPKPGLYVPYWIHREDQTTRNEPRLGWYFTDAQGVVWGPYVTRKRAEVRAREEKQSQ